MFRKLLLLSLFTTFTTFIGGVIGAKTISAANYDNSFLLVFNTPPHENPTADLTDDSLINIFDYSLLVANFGQ